MTILPRFTIPRFTIVAALLMSASAAAQKPQPQPRVKVFVTTVGAANGFTDPSKDNNDTAKDLRNALKGKKTVVLTEARADSAIVLVVLGRERANVTASFFGASRDCTVRVRFMFKDSESEMSASAQGGTASTGGAWKKAAGKVAKQVDEWIVANRTKMGPS